MAGQFAVSYVVASGSVIHPHAVIFVGSLLNVVLLSTDQASLTVRHYLIRDTDTAGAKKTLPDFLREYKEFRFVCFFLSLVHVFENFYFNFVIF